jgi:hypothetical protein
MTLYQSMWSVSIRMLCAMRALRWVVASVTVVMMLTMTTAAYGSHGTRRVSDVVADPMDVLYALTWDPGVLNREVWRSTDGGATWTPTAMAHPSFIGLAIAPTTPDPTLYVYSDCTGNSNCDGLRKSNDGGTTWASAGFPSAKVFAVTIAPDVPTTLYAHVDSAGTVGWFKSLDAGTNWTDMNWPVWQLVIDQAIPTRLYGVNGYDVLRSLDGGANWSVVLSLPPLPFTEDGRYDYRAHPPFLAVAGSTVYALLSAYSVPWCDGDFWGYCEWFAEPATVSYSNDGGSTWNVMVLGYYQVWDLAVHGSTLHAATTPYWDYQHTGAIQSTDGGAHWMDTDLNIGSTGLRVDTLAVYALTWEGLFKRVDGENWTATALAPHPAAVTSLNLNPTGVTFGSSFTGTVTLSAAAPAGGAMVTLSSSNPAVVPVPRFLIFGAGSTAASFTVWPNWATFTTVTISATGTTTRLAQVTVSGPATLTSLSLPPSVTSGTTSTGTVMLSSAAPSGGVTVTLSSSNPAVATVPGGVTVAAGGTTATFAVATSAVTTSTTVTISGTSGGVTQSAQLAVTPAAALTSLSLQPTSVLGGGTSTGTMTLSAAAPAGGTVVTVSSSNTAVVVLPASVTVPAGATTVGFVVTTNAVTSASVVTISATLGGVTQSAALTVALAPALVSISLSPASVRGGTPSTATITLSAAAPPVGLTVKLSSNYSSIAAVPSSITVAPGATSAHVTVPTSRPQSATDVAISANLGTVTKAATLTVRR